VAAILATSCASCHGDKLAGGAPNRIMTHADLLTVSRTDGTSSVAEVTIARLRDAADPMPPDGLLPAKDIEIIEDWIAAGMPEGSCEAPVDGTPPVSEYDTPLTCSSKKHWTRGDEESSLMHPGVACIECHDRDDGPSFIAAGTIYKTAHEPDDCNGIAGAGTKVVITDAAGKVFTQSVNGAGNFYFETKTNKMKLPYRAKIVSGTKTREMKKPVTTGDCNVCHTEKGAESAPGRVMAP
jgi:cytochrome c553